MNKGRNINGVGGDRAGHGAASSSSSSSRMSSSSSSNNAILSLSSSNENIKILTRENFIPAPLDHSLYQQVYDKYQATKKEKGINVNDNDNANTVDADADADADVSSSNKDGDAAPIDMKTYGKHILEKGCDLTVVFMDPRIHKMKEGSSMFFSLESVGAFLPEACVILQTSSCSFHRDVTDMDSSSVEDAIYQRIYDNSLPLFQKMIERGQVRVTFLQHQKYNFKDCHSYENPSSALMNIHYWSDVDEFGNGEYIAGVDNDSVLIMQNDSVICHPINIDLYRKYAYVGGVWLREHPFIQNTNMCRFLKQMWANYTRLRNGPFPDICTGDGTAPIGNGGLTLRSRSAMRKAIRDCPSRNWSGLDNLDKTTLRKSKCSVHGSINEDVYFGTILRGTNALLPTAIEAALFSVEMVWPEEVIDMYHGGSVGSNIEETQRFVSERGSIYKGATIDTSLIKAAKELTRDDMVPFGFHKPWWYFDNKVLHSKDVDQQCPLLKYMFHPDENRAKDLIVNKKPKSDGGVKGGVISHTRKLPKMIGRHLQPR